MSDLAKTSWADIKDDDEPAAPPALSNITEALSKTNLADDSKAVAKPEAKTEAKAEAKKDPSLLVDHDDNDEVQPIPLQSGIHPEDVNAEVEIVGTEGTIYKAAKSFQELGLDQKLLDGVTSMGFVNPSKIQAQALPIILEKDGSGQFKRNNIVAQAHHGSGKTATYSLSMLSMCDENEKTPQALCVCPTRELALQVAEVCRQLAKHTKIEVFAAVADSKRGQALTAQLVVGTPGTVLAKIKHKELNARKVKILVLDEADQMLKKDGFAENSVKIKKSIDRKAQVLLFSATFSADVRKFSKVFAPKAKEITVKRKQLNLSALKQFYIEVKSPDEKYEMLKSLYEILQLGQSIIFVHTVATAKFLANKLREEDYTVALLHGKDMGAKERDDVMNDFRIGAAKILITTNVLARGIDVESVTLVINYEMPLTRGNKPDPDTYMHRVGRAGRFGRRGVAINLIHDKKSLADMNYINDFFSLNIEKLPQDDLAEIEEKFKAWVDGK